MKSRRFTWAELLLRLWFRSIFSGKKANFFNSSKICTPRSSTEISTIRRRQRHQRRHKLVNRSMVRLNPMVFICRKRVLCRTKNCRRTIRTISSSLLETRRRRPNPFSFVCLRTVSGIRSAMNYRKRFMTGEWRKTLRRRESLFWELDLFFVVFSFVVQRFSRDSDSNNLSLSILFVFKIYLFDLV